MFHKINSIYTFIFDNFVIENERFIKTVLLFNKEVKHGAILIVYGNEPSYLSLVQCLQITNKN